MVDLHLAPIWRPAARVRRFPPLDRDITVDVCIIGAGITGLTLAHRLKESGTRVAVVDMRGVGMGATGHSSAHLATAMDIDYATLSRRFGHEGAQEVATKAVSAIQFIEGLARHHAIACDFQRVDGWRYTEDEAGVKALQQEEEAALRFGLDVALGSCPAPLAKAGLRFANQAVFDPVAYVAGLAEYLHSESCQIFEGTQVEKVVAGRPCRVDTGAHTITAETVVEATHVPMGLHGMMSARLASYMTYVIGLRLDGPALSGLYWDSANPYHYLRTTRDAEGTEILLVGGEDHRTGQEADTVGRFAALEAWARSRFPVLSVEWRWSWEVFEPVDGLPYIGRSSKDDAIYIATGFAGTGLTMGTVAGLDLADQILANSALEPSVFRPQRYKPLASTGTFLQENARVALRAVADRLQRVEPGHADAVLPGEGRVMEIDGQRAAVWCSPEGRLHVLSAICPHVGGVVAWNVATQTWDCPLHGSRFQPDGTLIEGPATCGLEQPDPPPPASR